MFPTPQESQIKHGNNSHQALSMEIKY